MGSFEDGPPAGLMDAPLPGEEPAPGTALARQSTGALAQATAGVIASRGETAAAAVAAQAKAQVEARYLMALQQPRSVSLVRRKLLDACQRRGFAASARYAKPVGKTKVVGWSIRFAEECARDLGNVLIDSAVVFDGDELRIVRVMVTDLEGNVSYPTDVTVQKTVERSSPDGKVVLASRTNSRGGITYIVAATDDDLLNKQNALVSKAMRTGILRIVPGDILEECEVQVAKTLAAADKEDPAGTAKAIADSFYVLGIAPDRLEKVLGNTLALVTPAQLTMMRTWYTAIKDGETSWREIEESFGEKPKSDAAAASTDKGTAGLRDRLKNRGNATPTTGGAES